MFAKLLAFVLMCLGSLVPLGFIAVAFPRAQEVAVHFGTSGGGLTYYHFLLLGTLGLILWIVGKI